MLQILTFRDQHADLEKAGIEDRETQKKTSVFIHDLCYQKYISNKQPDFIHVKRQLKVINTVYEEIEMFNSIILLVDNDTIKS